MKVLKDWIIAHKLLSIVIAAVIVVGAASAVVLPIALAHKHEFSAEWTTDAENHWHVCTGKDCDEVKDKAAHVYDNACDTTCNICGATRTVGEHVYDGEADATCNICGEARALPTRYKANDEAEWNAAVNFKEMPRFTLKTTMDGAYGEIVRDGNVIWGTEYEDGESGRKKLGERFYVKDGEAYYIVKWIKDSVYERNSLEKDEYENMFARMTMLAVGGSNYSDFTYNEETHKYSNDDETSVHTLTFAGGVISKIEAVCKGLNSEEPDMVCTTTVTFEENTITLPESHVFKIAAERYANALNFKDEDGKFYNNIDIVFINGTTKVFQYTVTEKAAYEYSTASDAENLETIWTNEDGRGVIYTKKNADSKWVRTESMEPFEDLASCVLPVSGIKNYTTSLTFGDKLTYNEEDQMYHGSYKQVSTVTVDVSMSFEDGKLVKIMYESTNSNSGRKVQGLRTITYGNAVIEMPKADEVGKTAFALPYNEDNNEYLLENISFSAGETKWFAFEVTKTIYDGNKGTSGNYDISGSFSFDGSAVLTIEAENASGGKIENTSTKNGKIYLEELSAAGTYYVKITASEACNGKLSISFA